MRKLTIKMLPSIGSPDLNLATEFVLPIILAKVSGKDSEAKELERAMQKNQESKGDNSSIRSTNTQQTGPQIMEGEL